jgi:hypothetical protein
VTGIASELIGLTFFIVTGWVALWPARRTLGPAAYHLAALPAGLLGGVVATTVSSLTGRPLDILSACIGSVLFAIAAQALLRRLGSPQDRTRAFSAWSFLIAGGAAGILGTIFGFARLTVTNNDSVMSYWPLGVELSRKGAFSGLLLATRSVLIPAFSAIYHSFGSDWAYVIYPMLAVTLLGWLAVSLLNGPLASLGRRAAWGIAGVAVLALLIEPSFLFNAVFVHSHTVSAVYLLMSLTCIWLAARPSANGMPVDIDATYLVLAGLFAAGFTLSRPDGPAYAFVPIAAAIAVLTVSKVDAKHVAAFFAPLLLVVLTSFGAAYITLGFWVSGKLSGKRTAAVLAVFVCAVAGPWIVAWLDKRLPFRVSAERFHSVFVAGAAALTAAALALKWHSTAHEALTNAWLNLLAGRGGYNYLWWGVIALMVLSLLTRDAMRKGSWTRPAFLSVLLFFVIAAAVHGISHAGRVGAGDSLNRVAFHALPLIIWYLAAVVARIFSEAPAANPAEAAEASA